MSPITIASIAQLDVNLTMLSLCFLFFFFALTCYVFCLLLLQLHAAVVQASDITNTVKSELCIRIAEAEFKLCEGADEQLQLLDVLAFALGRNI